MLSANSPDSVWGITKDSNNLVWVTHPHETHIPLYPQGREASPMRPLVVK